jgi:hypothetical protein
MVCVLCGANIAASFSFCPECGAKQPGAAAPGGPVISPPTEPVAATTRAPLDPTMAVPSTAVTSSAATTTAVPATTAIAAAPATTAMPATTAVPVDQRAVFRPEAPVVPVQQVRYTPIELTPDPWPLIALGIVAAAAAIVAVLVPLYSIDTDVAVVETSFQDLASNALGAGITAAIVVIVGAIVASARGSQGGGLIGGAGLAIATLAVMPVGITDQVFRQFSDRLLGSGTFTHEIGFFLAIGAGVLGVVLFLVSIGWANSTGSTHPAVRVLSLIGLLGTLATVTGVLIPEDGASFADNFTGDNGQTLSLIIRAVGILLFLLAGVVGFLNTSAWGMGVALGGSSVWFWLWLSAQYDLGAKPTGPAFVNPSGGEIIDPTPHVVTTVGILVVFGCALIGTIVAAVTADSGEPDFR